MQPKILQLLMSGGTSCVAMSTAAAAAAMLRCCYGDESQLTLGSLWQVRARRHSVMIFWHHLASLPSTRNHRQHDPPGNDIFNNEN